MFPASAHALHAALLIVAVYVELFCLNKAEGSGLFEMPGTVQYRTVMAYGGPQRDPSATCTMGVDGSSRRAKYDQHRVGGVTF